MIRKSRIGACLAAAGATAAVAAAPVDAAIWVTLDRDRAEPGATVRARAGYLGGERLRLFLTPEPVVEGRYQPLLVTVAGGVEIRPSGAPPFRVVMVPSTMLDEIRADRAALVFVGEIAPNDGEGGSVAFTVPDLLPGAYRVLAHCKACAENGGSLLPGEALAIERAAGAPVSWRLIGAGGVVLAAACAGVWLARRRAVGALGIGRERSALRPRRAGRRPHRRDDPPGR